jgi:hypothetical protein
MPKQLSTFQSKLLNYFRNSMEIKSENGVKMLSVTLSSYLHAKENVKIVSKPCDFNYVVYRMFLNAP